MNNFLSNNHIIHGLSPRKKARLIGANNFIQNRADSIDKNLSEDLVRDIIESNRSKAHDILGILNFRYKCNKTCVPIFREIPVHHAFFYKIKDRTSNLIPVTLVEARLKPIRSRGLKGFHTKNNISHFIPSYRGIQD